MHGSLFLIAMGLLPAAWAPLYFGLALFGAEQRVTGVHSEQPEVCGHEEGDMGRHHQCHHLCILPAQWAICVLTSDRNWHPVLLTWDRVGLPAFAAWRVLTNQKLTQSWELDTSYHPCLSNSPECWARLSSLYVWWSGGLERAPLLHTACFVSTCPSQIQKLDWN